MNLKITKKMISILCAITISTSSMGASVGAIKAYPGVYALAEPPADLKNAVDNLNNTLTLSTNTIKTSIDNIRELSQNNQNNEEVSIKLGIILSQLDGVIDNINHWNDFSIENLELVNRIQQKITELNLNTLLDETKDINKLDSLEQNSNKIFNEMEKINQELNEENEQLLSQGQIFRFVNHNNDNNNDNNNNENNNIDLVNIGIQNNLKNKYEEFFKQVSEFRAWRANKNIDKIDDITVYSRNEALKYYEDTKNNVDYFTVKNFDKLAKKASKEMKEFQNKYNSIIENNEQNILNKLNFRSKLISKSHEFNQRSEEFKNWKNNGHAGIDDNEIRQLKLQIRENCNNINGQLRTLEYETAKKIIEMMDQAIIKMEELKNKNDISKLNNKPELKKQLGNIQTELTKELHKEKTSNQLVEQKVEEIIKILENQQFNDYNENLNIVLPIIDSLHISQQKKILKKVGDKTVEKYIKFTEEEVQTNKQARSKFEHILSKSIASHVDETINYLNSNDITKPIAEHIKKSKSKIVDKYTKTIINSTEYLKYTAARKVLDLVSNDLNKLQFDYILYNEDMKSISKNQVKDLYEFYFNQFLNKISDTEHLYSNDQDSKKDVAEFNMLFRKYAEQITGMRSDEEKRYIQNHGQLFLQTIDHLKQIREKYKTLNSAHEKMSYAIQARIQLYLDRNDAEARKEDENELKKAIDDAKKAFDKFHKCVIPIDDQFFAIIED